LYLITYTHTHTHTVGLLYEGSARERDFYLTKHNTHKTQISNSPASLEPEIPASKHPQTHILNSRPLGLAS